jgi:hypothetical protein
MTLGLFDAAFVGGLAGSSAPTDPYFSNVSLLLHGDGTNGSATIIDSSPSPKTVTAVSSAQISTTQSKFPGGSSLYFTVPSGRVRVANNASLDLVSTQYTVEYFIYPDYADAYPGFVCLGGKQTESPAAGWSSWLVDGKITAGLNGNFNSITASVALTKKAWTHVAIVDNGTQTTIFIDGISRGSSATRNTTATNTVFTFGCNEPGVTWGATYSFTGYIDDLRITKGVARYTANFAPPTAPFPDI